VEASAPRAPHSALLTALNGAWHRRAVLVLLVIALAHWLVHVIQAFQVFALGLPRPEARGVLGEVWPWLAESEWLHFVLNGLLLVGLLLLRPGFRGAAREWWTAALGIQIWHFFEHTLLLGQNLSGHFLFGKGQPTSILQLVVPRMELHLYYNGVVMVPFLAAICCHLWPPERGRRRRATLGFAVLALIPFVALPPSLALRPAPAAARPARLLEVRLDPVGGTRVPQGRPFKFRATARNVAANAASFALVLALQPKTGGRQVSFDGWTQTVPPHASVTRVFTVTTSQWFADLGRFHVIAQPFIRRAVIQLDVTPSPVEVPRFEDVAARTGLHASIPGFSCGEWAAGAAWGDVDGDGDPDVFLPRGNRPPQLWINDGGHFVDEAAARGISGGGQLLGAVFVDYDNDGDQDLYVTANGPNLLYRNDGKGVFENVAAAAGVADHGPSQSAAFGDYDRDGYVDLYVADHVGCRNGRKLAFPDHLYHNEGDGMFTDKTALLEQQGSTNGAGFQATWVDVDGDGDLDLYLANDQFGPNPEPNVLWRNDGPAPGGGWRFTVVPGAGAALRLSTMGIAPGDYDRDLDIDLLLTNMGPSVLLRNDGDLRFVDAAAAAHVSRPMENARDIAITWGAVFADLNNDGWEDLYVPAGRLEAMLLEPNAVFTNAHDRTFLDHSAPSRADDPGISRGVALADYDKDGRIDLLVVDQLGHPRLYRNVTPRRGTHWLEVRLVGRVSNRDGCGARAILVAGQTRMLRQLFCGGTSLGSGSEPVLHFGLGHQGTLTKLVIVWPSARRQVVERPPIDRRITILEQD